FVLPRAPASMPERQRKILRELNNANKVLSNKKAMIVDDDMRNIFAVSSLLEDKGMFVLPHDNGRDAVKALQGAQQVDVILMDIMMPEMDGIDTIREIRRIPACKYVPVIAVTAKAMKGDREKCMEAGAWDYLSKPVDSIASPVVPEILRAKVKVFVDLYLLARQAKRQADEHLALAEERAARAAAEKASRRLSFLAQASVALTSSLDFDAITQELSR